jgi:HAMP domain-containing protein
LIQHAPELLTAALVVAVLWIIGAFPVAFVIGRRLRKLGDSYPEVEE